MSILNYFRNRRRNSAEVAKERLQIIVSHEKLERQASKVDLNALEQKLVDTIATYLGINPSEVNVELARDHNRSVLELNVTLPDTVS